MINGSGKRASTPRSSRCPIRRSRDPAWRSYRTVTPAAPARRKLALICAKGGLDECYPVLIMANAARMTGIETSVFFT